MALFSSYGLKWGSPSRLATTGKREGVAAGDRSQCWAGRRDSSCGGTLAGVFLNENASRPGAAMSLDASQMLWECGRGGRYEDSSSATRDQVLGHGWNRDLELDPV